MSDAWHDLNSTVGLARIASIAPVGSAQTVTETEPEVVWTLGESYGRRAPQLAPELTTRLVVRRPHRSLAHGVSQDVILSPAAKEPKTDREIPPLAENPWPSCLAHAAWRTQDSNVTRDALEPLEPIPVPSRIWTAAYLTSHTCSFAISLSRPPLPALSDDPFDPELGLIDPDPKRELELLAPAGKPQTGLPSERPRALGSLGYPSSRVIPLLRPLAPRLRVPMPSPENVQNIA
jgi:hypothetical protein